MVEEIDKTEVSDSPPQKPAEEPLEAPQPSELPESSPAEAPLTEEFDWSKYSGTDRYKGKSVQDVIDHYAQREYQYGQQGNELGRLRGKEQELNALKQQITGKPEEKKADFSDVETAMFVDEFNKNPLAAINKYLAPKLTESLQRQVLDNVSQQMKPIMDERVQTVADQQEFTAFEKAHPEYREHQPMMHRLMAPDYLGENSPYEEVYNLAIMAKEDKTLFGTTCALMQRGVPFEVAKKFASYEKNAAVNADTQKEQIKQDVHSVRHGSKHSTVKQGTNEPEILTMDEAFAAD